MKTEQEKDLEIDLHVFENCSTDKFRAIFNDRMAQSWKIEQYQVAVTNKKGNFVVNGTIVFSREVVEIAGI